eukprot:TRINITY_DN34732_c0_g1_i1.p1 TRINITY_DN34732_c0_g1~~TRINITY_DN34732_c0_g1_i1.p1  ORF type:complete len:519 (-),score=34.94 TRINITY_DN34732_c0_g1_i1:47-1603(-)
MDRCDAHMAIPGEVNCGGDVRSVDFNNILPTELECSGSGKACNRRVESKSTTGDSNCTKTANSRLMSAQSLDEVFQRFFDTQVSVPAGIFGRYPVCALIRKPFWQAWYWLVGPVCAIWGTSLFVHHCSVTSTSPDPLLVMYYIGILSFGLLIATACVLGSRGSIQRSKRTFSLGFAVNGTINLIITFLSLLGVGGWEPYPWLQLLVLLPTVFLLLCWGWIWLWREDWYIIGKLVSATFVFTLGLVKVFIAPCLPPICTPGPSFNQFGCPRSWDSAGWVDIFTSIVIWGLVTLYYISRRRMKHRAIMGLADDVKRYHQAWMTVLQDFPQELDDLSECAASFAEVIGENYPKKILQPTRSLSLIFEDACMVHPILHELARSWSQRAGGRHVPATLKSSLRAFQKVQRIYHDDSSCLLDVARSCIVFESVTQLLACLKIVVADSNVCRIKNRLDPSFDALKENCGYRDVLVNIQFPVPGGVGGQFQRSHVGELQLILHAMYSLKSDGGHKRYIEYRNMCGS